MKKLIAILLALMLLLSLVACQSKEPEKPAEPAKPEEPAAPAEPAKPEEPAAPAEPAKPEEPAAPAEPAEPAKPEEPAAPAEPVPAAKLYVVNNYVDDMEPLYDELQTRYNAYWLDSYSVSKFAEDNFWFMPADDTIVSIISFEDLYDYNAGLETPLTWELFKDQYICLDVPEALKESYSTGTVCGLGMTKSLLPYNQGYIICGAEAMILPTTDEEGYVAKWLFEDVGMAEAETYEFHCGDGYVHEVAAEDLEDEFIYMDETGRVHANCLEWPDYPLMDIQFIVPAETTEESTPAAEGVTKINFVNNGIGVLDAEATKTANEVVRVEGATVKAPLGGTVQEGYCIADLLAAMEIPACETVTAISFADGYKLDQTYDAFTQKYLVMNDSKDRGPYTVGTNQDYGDVVKNSGYFIMGDNVLLCVPEYATQEEPVCVTDILAAVGIDGVKTVNVVCSDGYSEEVDAEDLGELFIFHIEDRVDTSSVAYPDYTLMDVATLEIYK